MGDRLKAPFRAYISGGGVLTFIGTAEDQAVYWSLQGFNTDTGLPWPPVGTLRKIVTFTDKSNRATNVYMAPAHQPMIRYGLGYKYGTSIEYGDAVTYGEPVSIYDQVTTKAVLE